MNSPFDSKKWNDERVFLEDKAIKAINELSDYMGCNSFTLNYGQGSWDVEHKPE